MMQPCQSLALVTLLLGVVFGIGPCNGSQLDETTSYYAKANRTSWLRASSESLLDEKKVSNEFDNEADVDWIDEEDDEWMDDGEDDEEWSSHNGAAQQERALTYRRRRKGRRGQIMPSIGDGFGGGSCRCPYPGERGGYTFNGVTVLPNNNPSCRRIQFVCPGEPCNGPLWTCPRPPIRPPGGMMMMRPMMMRPPNPIPRPPAPVPRPPPPAPGGGGSSSTKGSKGSKGG